MVVLLDQKQSNKVSGLMRSVPYVRVLLRWQNDEDGDIWNWRCDDGDGLHDSDWWWWFPVTPRWIQTVLKGR